MKNEHGGIGKGCLIAAGIGCGVLVLGAISCFALMGWGKGQAAEAMAQVKARAAAAEAAKTPEQRKAEADLKVRQWTFIQKHWMTDPGAMFYSVQDKGGGLVIAKADLRWYTAVMDEKSLACESIWSYYFKGKDEHGAVWVEDARTGKHLASFSKDMAGLQMED